MLMKSRINQYLSKELLIDLDNISRDNTIPSNNRKVELMVQYMNAHRLEYDRIAPGTNRYSILVDGYVFKIALDERGKVDNWAEFYLSKELQPYVTKTYECNGLIAVAEYVSPIPKDEFISLKDKIRRILDQLSKDWLLGDMGTITKNFMNWGIRADGQIVCLDYAYTYRIVGNEMICGNVKRDGKRCQAFLEYDENFDHLECPNCGKKYDFIDIRNRMREDYEDEVRDNAKRVTVKFPFGIDELEVDEDNTIINQEDIDMKYNDEYNEVQYTAEEVDAMLLEEIEKFSTPLDVPIEEDELETCDKIHFDMREAEEAFKELADLEPEFDDSKESIARRKLDRIIDNLSDDEDYYADAYIDYDEYDEQEWETDPEEPNYYSDVNDHVVEHDLEELIKHSFDDEVLVYKSEVPVCHGDHGAGTIGEAMDALKKSIDGAKEYISDARETVEDLIEEGFGEEIVPEEVEEMVESITETIVGTVSELMVLDDTDNILDAIEVVPREGVVVEEPCEVHETEPMIEIIPDEPIESTLVDESTFDALEDVISSEDVELEEAELTSNDNLESVNCERVFEEELTSSFIQVINDDEEDDNDELRGILEEDIPEEDSGMDYYDEYDDMHEQAYRDSKNHNKNIKFR